MDNRERSHEQPYRKGVLAVFKRPSDGYILVCERSNPRGNWQFPQGGVDFDESAEDALYREMTEELGCKHFKILQKLEETTKYDFPQELIHIPIAHSYRGQEHSWFLCEYADHHGPDLDQAEDDEFLDFKYVPAEEALELFVNWKKPAMREGLYRLGLIGANSNE